MDEEPSCSYSNKKMKKIVAPDLSEAEQEHESIENNQDTASESESIHNTDDFSLRGMPESYKETYEAFVKEVKALASVPITHFITPDYKQNFKPFNLRYYEDKYSVKFVDSEKTHSDILIRIHSNKLFLISLASGNDIIKCDRVITGLNFLINNKDRSKINLSGKRKKGAKAIGADTILCQVKCEGIPKMFNIRAGIPGRVIEINELVKEDPNLLRNDPKGNGFLAVLAPLGHPNGYEKAMNNLNLLNEEQYIEHLSKRVSK